MEDFNEACTLLVDSPPEHSLQKNTLLLIISEKGRWNRVLSSRGETCFYLRIEQMSKPDIDEVRKALTALNIPFSTKETHAFSSPEEVIFITRENASQHTILLDVLSKAGMVGALREIGVWCMADSKKDGECLYLRLAQIDDRNTDKVKAALCGLGIPFKEKATGGFGKGEESVLSVKVTDAKNHPAAYAALMETITHPKNIGIQPPHPSP